MRQASNGVSKASGFTLTEILIVVAMVGILASIAYPSYRNYIQRANRADAQQILLQGAQQAERFFAANNTYVGFPLAPFNRSPESGTAVYTMTATSAANSFSILATPATAGVNSKDGCLQITSTGAKTWNGKRTATGCGTTYNKTWADRE